jgi:hypothetical protein
MTICGPKIVVAGAMLFRGGQPHLTSDLTSPCDTNRPAAMSMVPNMSEILPSSMFYAFLTR